MFGVGETAMTVFEVGADAFVTLLMTGIVRIGESEFLQHSELRFGEV